MTGKENEMDPRKKLAEVAIRGDLVETMDAEAEARSAGLEPGLIAAVVNSPADYLEGA